MFQRWLHLLFLHWPVEPQTIQSTLPLGLQVDTFAGKGWIGIVPFFMRGVRPVGLPPVVGLSNFLELNLRTYVRDRDARPGIWFYSLDASQPLAVWIARLCFALPYEHATMRANIDGGEIAYSSVRTGSVEALHYRYRPSLDLEEADIRFPGIFPTGKVPAFCMPPRPVVDRSGLPYAIPAGEGDCPRTGFAPVQARWIRDPIRAACACRLRAASRRFDLSNSTGGVVSFGVLSFEF